MINKTPTNLDKFPVPVSGQKIPGGWFARLVSFINSLVLHGDGQYLTVKHTQAGQTIAPTPALLQALGQRGAPPAAGGGGGATGIESDVTGGTASITLTGGTGSVNLVGTGNVTLSENADGEIEINSAGGGGAVIGFPDYANPLATNVYYNTTYPGTAYADQSIWLIGCINSVFDPNNYALSAHVEISISNGIITNTILN